MARRGNLLFTAKEATEADVDDVFETCVEVEHNEGGSRYPGMSYEDGVRAVIEWLRGDGDHPFEDA